MTKQDEYLALVAKSGKRKFRATSLLPYGDEQSRFEAAVLFHEAAAIEGQALSLLDDLSIEVRLGAAIEQCACLVLGLDVVDSARAWREVEEISAGLPAEVASAHRDRLDPLYQEARRDLFKLLERAPILVRAKFQWEKVAEPDKPGARAEIAALLDRFPGEAMFHLIAAKAAIDEARIDELRWAVQRAHRLLPGSPLLRAYWLVMLGDLLAYPDATMSQTEAEDELARTYEDLQRRPADAVVYLGFIFASLAAFYVTRSRGEDAEVHQQRALWAAEEGAKQPSVISQDVHTYFLAAGHLISLLTAKMDAVMSIFEVMVREWLRNSGLDQPHDHGASQSTPASLIRIIALSAGRGLPPSQALDLAA